MPVSNARRRLALLALNPRPTFALLHADTTWKFAPDRRLRTLDMTIDGEVDRVIQASQRRGVFD